MIWEKIKDGLLSTFLVYSSANIAVAIIQGLAGIVQARWIAPDVLGEFRKYGIITSYSVIALVLVQDGLQRQFPFLIGKGKKEEALAVAGAAKCWYVFVALVMSVFFAALSISNYMKNDFVAAVGWGAQVIIIIQMTYGSFLQIIYRRSMEFKRLSYNGLITALISVFTLLFVRLWGFYGVALRTCTSDVIRVVLDRKYLPMKITARWDWKEFVSLAKISIPLSVVGYLKTSFISATFSYFVLRFCGEGSLGLFGMAMTFHGFAMIMNMSLSQIICVRLANKYGETESFVQCMRSVLLPTVLSFIMAVVVACALCFFIGPFISHVIPKYVESIHLIWILSIILPINALSLPIGLLKTALKYKAIYTLAVIKIFSVIVMLCIFPKMLVWYTVALVIGEAIDVLSGYGMLFYYSKIAENKNANK